MSKIINFGIVGCGNIAPSHANAIKNIDGANLYSVCDIIPEKANKFAENNQVKKAYYDYKEMIKDTKVDVICVCVPSGIHGEISKAAARAGKHIVAIYMGSFDIW